MKKRFIARPVVLAGSALTILSTVALFLVSRGKWSDAVIDVGTEWLYADALARGGLLYRDVVYWFGPFTPYFQAAFLRVFGSSFQALALCGIAGACGVLAALFLALRRVTGATEALLWTAVAIPALVFMPNSGGAILGMGYRIWHPAGFALLAGALASSPGAGGSIRRSLAAGTCAGLAGLCRTEWGVIALFGVLAALWTGRRSGKGFSREALAAAAAALATFGGVLAAFAAAAGPAAILHDAPVLLVGIPRDTPAGSLLSGLRGWRDGIPLLLYSAALWAGVVCLAGVLAARGVGRERTAAWLGRMLACLAAAAALAAMGFASGAVLFSAAPLVCLAAVVAGISRGRGPRAAALVGFGCLGLLASHRRFFHIGDSGYVAPPLLLAFVCAAGILQTIWIREKERVVRLRFRAALAAALALAAGLAFLGRAVQYATDDRSPVPGTGAMLSAPPEVAHGLESIAGAVAGATTEKEGLVVIPEGGVLNEISGRRNPMRHKISIPGYLRESNEDDFLGDLRHARPAAIVILDRPAGEYRRGLFGTDYGRRTRAWIEDNYLRRPSPTRRATIFLAPEKAGS